MTHPSHPNTGEAYTLRSSSLCILLHPPATLKLERLRVRDVTVLVSTVGMLASEERRVCI